MILPVDLGEPGVGHVTARLERLHSNCGGLNARARSVQVQRAVSFATTTELPADSDAFRYSSNAFRAGSDSVKALISSWLAEKIPPQRQRLIVIEDTIGRRSDARDSDDGAQFYGDCLYFIGRNSSRSASQVEVGMNLGNHEDLGFLIEIERQFSTESELTERDIEQLVAGVAAVFVWAWDNEGLILAPVQSGMQLDLANA